MIVGPSGSRAIDASWSSVGYSIYLNSGTLTPGAFPSRLHRQDLAFSVTGGTLV